MSHIDCLIRGDEYLKNFPDFKLLGRDADLQRLHGILMRKRSNNAHVVGPGGAGASALCMGLESTRDDPGTPMDIVSKRKFWLDTDTLFAFGDTGVIKETFQKLSGRLARTSQAILIIDDMHDFVEAAHSNGCTNLINLLMRDIKRQKYQAVIETRDENLDVVIKCHSDMREVFTMMDLRESEGEDLEAIVTDHTKVLEKFHGIRVHPEVINVAIDVTSKYRASDASLSRAQPERTLTLLDRALTKYRQDAHAKPPELESLEQHLHAVKNAPAGDKTVAGTLNGEQPVDLKKLQAKLESEIENVTAAWDTQRERIRRLHRDQLDAEQLIREKEDQIVELQEKAKQRRSVIEAMDGQTHLESDAQEDGTVDVSDFVATARDGGFDSPAIRELREGIEQLQHAAAQSKAQYDQLMEEVNTKLLLTKDHVLQKYSSLSGIPTSRLDQDEKEKLRTLDQLLMARVYDQDHVIRSLASSVKAARVGLRDRNKPMGAFIFIGPSGTGKTELAKALAQVLFEDERALLRLDMSEYQEKHAVAKLIGAPPGYEGFEAGGILTNAMRRNPRRIVLMDEIEKADVNVFDLCLQIVDDARLSDNVGRTCSFADSVVILTSNIGSEYFLDADLSYEHAVELAARDLEERFRPEFLNRFNGRRNIKFFNALSLEAIQKIAQREIAKTNKKVAASGLEIEMPQDQLALMCRCVYRPKDGARGIVGYINDHLDEELTNTILEKPNTKGVMEVRFEEATQTLRVASPEVKNQDALPQAVPRDVDVAIG